MNLVRRLEQRAAAKPHHPALVFQDRTWTYAEVDDWIGRIAGGLRQLGVAASDRVAVMLPNRPSFHLCSHAAWKLGAVEVPMNVMYREEELEHILRDCGARVALVLRDRYDAVRGLQHKLPELREVVLVDGDGGAGVTTFDELATSGPSVGPGVDLDEDDLAVVAYTSGTTGYPKGAMLSHQQLSLSSDVLREVLDLGPDDDILQMLPCFHSNASLIGVIFAWQLGSTAILLDGADPKSLAETVARTRPSFFACVPTILHDILHLTEEVDFDSVRFAIYGAAPTPAHVREAVEHRFGLRLLQAYGMTEAPNVLVLDPLDASPRPGAAGQQLEHVAITIVDDDDRDVPVGEVGEICAGPATTGRYANRYRPMLGYWNDPDATAGALRGGRFHTGDMGVLDDDGFLSVVDRKKDMIIRGGNNIFTAELERVLVEDPRVDQAYVIGIPDERLGEVPKAFVLLAPDADADAEDIKRIVAARLATYKRLEQVAIVTEEELPRNVLGKVLKRELAARERAAGGT